MIFQNKNVFCYVSLSLFLVALILSLVGCRGEKKMGVEGTVTRKGVPLDSGVITFTPDAAKGTTHGANAITDIKDGKFALPEKFGISGGWYKVIISGIGTTKGEGDDAVETQPFSEYMTSYEFKADDKSPVVIDIPK
jgi:hypothetical protein